MNYVSSAVSAGASGNCGRVKRSASSRHGWLHSAGSLSPGCDTTHRSIKWPAAARTSGSAGRHCERTRCLSGQGFWYAGCTGRGNGVFSAVGAVCEEGIDREGVHGFDVGKWHVATFQEMIEKVCGGRSSTISTYPYTRTECGRKLLPLLGVSIGHENSEDVMRMCGCWFISTGPRVALRVAAHWQLRVSRSLERQSRVTRHSSHCIVPSLIFPIIQMTFVRMLGKTGETCRNNHHELMFYYSTATRTVND